MLVGGLVLVPIARSIITSTTERHGQDTVFVGLDNYLALVGDEQFHTGVVNSFVFTAYAEVFKVVLDCPRPCCCTTGAVGGPCWPGCSWCRGWCRPW
ncbi:hypothetical protein NKG94_33995 [Micromonospora sp. M12]